MNDLVTVWPIPPDSASAIVWGSALPVNASDPVEVASGLETGMKKVLSNPNFGFFPSWKKIKNGL